MKTEEVKKNHRPHGMTTRGALSFPVWRIMIHRRLPDWGDLHQEWCSEPWPLRILFWGTNFSPTTTSPCTNFLSSMLKPWRGGAIREMSPSLNMKAIGLSMHTIPSGVLRWNLANMASNWEQRFLPSESTGGVFWTFCVVCVDCTRNVETGVGNLG